MTTEHVFPFQQQVGAGIQPTVAISLGLTRLELATLILAASDSVDSSNPIPDGDESDQRILNTIATAERILDLCQAYRNKRAKEEEERAEKAKQEVKNKTGHEQP